MANIATLVPHVDSVAVLDTGSTDKTIETLRRVVPAAMLPGDLSTEAAWDLRAASAAHVLVRAGAA